jgi:hypothetical protein
MELCLHSPIWVHGICRESRLKAPNRQKLLTKTDQPMKVNDGTVF